MSTSEPSPAPGGTIPPEELKQALKAFKKRLKLTRLDSESKLGVGPLSGGKNWGVAAISPPDQFPRAVWDELARLGKIKDTGHGLFSLLQP